MSELRTEQIPYEDTHRIIGIELDDGTFLENYETELQIDDGTPFLLELLPDPYGSTEYDAFGNGEAREITHKQLQRLYDDGRLSIIE